MATVLRQLRTVSVWPELADPGHTLALMQEGADHLRRHRPARGDEAKILHRRYRGRS